MDVAKAIRKTMPQKSNTVGSIKSTSTPLRLQATKNHISTLRESEAKCILASSKSGPVVKPDLCPKPDLCLKPQALVEKVRQEKKLRDERVKDKAPPVLAEQEKVGLGNKAEVFSNERVKGSDCEGQASSSNEGGKRANNKAKHPVAAAPAGSRTTEERLCSSEESSNHGDSNVSGTPSVTSCDAGMKVDQERKGQSTTHSEGRLTKSDEEMKSNGLRKQPTRTLSNSSDGSPVSKKVGAAHTCKYGSSCPNETSLNSRHLLNKQSSDITFDRSTHRLNMMTSSLDYHSIRGVVKEEEVGGDGDKEVEKEESFRTKVTRFARVQFQRAISFGSTLTQSPHAQVSTTCTAGGCAFSDMFVGCHYYTCGFPF